MSTAKTGTSFTDRVMAFCRANPLRWIPAVAFEAVGGRQAWRSRISQARQRFEAAGEGTIENRYRRQVGAHGEVWTLSEYCYFPAGSAVAVDEQGARGHDLNAPIEGRLI